MSSKLISYKASATARQFHASNAFVKGIRGPFGCVSPDTKVITVDGPRAISSLTEPTLVLSWNSQTNRFVLSPTGGAFPKGKDYLYRVSTTQGELVASGHHRICDAQGKYQRVDSLYPGQTVSLCSDNLSLTSYENYPLSSGIGESRYLRTALDCLGRYAGLARLYGQQLQSPEDICQFLPPLLADAPELSHFSSPVVLAVMDESEELLREHIRLNQSASLKQIGGCSLPAVHPGEALAGCYSSLPSAHNGQISRERLQSLLNLISRLPSELSSECSGSFVSSSSKGIILKIERETVKREYWDMQVLDTNNYVTADGTINHNSGKSVACCFEIFMRAKEQTPGVDGIRRSRWIVARNTQPQLETTTIRTWLDWFPEHIFGKMSRKPPFSHHVKFGDVELEVIFLALDKPEDVKKLLSFEVTGIWFNEAREMDYDLLSGATGRVGRYPPKKDKPAEIPDNKWPKWHGIIMDTNPPTDDHWWYKAAEEQSWAVDKFGNPVDPLTIPEKQRWEFFAQPSGLSKEAENIENLPGGYDYYKQQLGGKTEEWINVYVHGHYGFIKQGQPVYKGAWNPDIHLSKDPIPLSPSGIIYVGVDSSGRHPAAVFVQKSMSGQLSVVHEFCVQDDEGMGATTFARALKSEMGTKFPKHDFEIYGDPAGAWGSQNDERTYFDILRAAGIHIKPSPGLRINERIEAVISTLSTNIKGQPALLVSPACKILVRGMNGGYRYRKLNVSGEGRYDDKPEKNRYADVQDSLQYLLCGIGALNKMYGRSKTRKETVFAKTGFSI